jgi:ABC-type nitrate/sulfonate/bicarbonate transport system permease component
MRKSHHPIYQSAWHLAATLAVIVAPFLFLYFFSQVAHISSRELFRDVFVSSWRLFIAYLISAVLAWIWAVAFYKGRRAVIVLPFFDVLQSFPTFAALPTAIYFWGATNTTVIFFLIFTIIWPIFFSIVSSMKLIKRDWEEAAIMARLSPLDRFRKFLWPASIPGLAMGTIVGLGEGWEALVATEIIVKMPTGLGSFFTDFSGQPAIIGFGILGLLILIFSINKLLWLPLMEWSHRQMEE